MGESTIQGIVLQLALAFHHCHHSYFLGDGEDGKSEDILVKSLLTSVAILVGL